MEKDGGKKDTVCENSRGISFAGEKRVRRRSEQVCRAGDDLRVGSQMGLDCD